MKTAEEIAEGSTPKGRAIWTVAKWMSTCDLYRGLNLKADRHDALIDIITEAILADRKERDGRVIEVLEPFAKVGEWIPATIPNSTYLVISHEHGGSINVTTGHLKKASALMRTKITTSNSVEEMKDPKDIASEIYCNWANNESTKTYEACLVASFAAAIENERKELTDLVATLTSERDEAIEKLKQRDERVIEVLESGRNLNVDDGRYTCIERVAVSDLLAELRKEKE